MKTRTDPIAFSLEEIASRLKPDNEREPGERPRATGYYALSAPFSDKDATTLLTAIRSVYIIEGQNVAQIDITYDIDTSQNRYKSDCMKLNEEYCLLEQDP